MQRLFVVRHGETEFNGCGRLQGRLDSNLTERGRTQVQRVGEKLSLVLQDADVMLFASPLGRAQATAKILQAYLNVSTFHTEDRLAEIALGDWEGMTMEDIEFTHPGVLYGSSRFDWAYRAPNGESRAVFLARLNSWLNEIADIRGNILAVSHGWTGLGLRSAYTGLPFEQVTALQNSHEAVFELAKGAIRQF